jgi:hypothetical protein
LLTTCQENLCYLGYVEEVWKKILPSPEAQQKLNEADVKALELTAPGACKADKERLYGQLRGGNIFGAFNEQEREAIWEIVLVISSDRLIPSFYSYFEDINYFQGPVKCIKPLLDSRDSVSAALLRAFKDENRSVGQYVVQESESRFVVRPGDLAEDFALRQIWMIAMRYSGAKLDWQPSKATLCAIATHAYHLGFQSAPILNLMQGSPDRQIARKTLLEARRPDRFQYDAAAFEDYIDQIVRFFSTAEALTEEETRNIYEVDNDGRPPKRCGVPNLRDHDRDKLSLFLDTLHDTNEKQYPEMTSFFVRRSVYFAFWGKPAHIVNHSTSHERTRTHEEEMGEIEAEETQELVERRQCTQFAESRASQRPVEQEREGPADEGYLATPFEQTQTEENQLAQLLDQTQTEKNQLAQLLDQTQTEKNQLAQLLEQTQTEKNQLAQLLEQTQTEKNQLAQLLDQTQTEKNQLTQLLEQLQTEKQDWQQQPNENGHWEAEQAFEETEMTSNGQKLLGWHGEMTIKKRKPPRGIGAARKERNRERQIDLVKSIGATRKKHRKQVTQINFGKHATSHTDLELDMERLIEERQLKAKEFEQAEMAERQRKAEELEQAEMAETQRKAQELEQAAEMAERQRKAEELEQAAEMAERQRKAEELEQAEMAERQRKAQELEQAEMAERQRKAQELEQAEMAERQRKAEELEQAEMAERQRKAQELEQAESLQQLQEERENENDTRKAHTEPQPDNASPASLWSSKRGTTDTKKIEPLKSIGAAEKERKEFTQINSGKVIEPATQSQAGKDQVELG